MNPPSLQRPAGQPGGFFTGWRGVLLLIVALITAGIVAATAVIGGMNTYPRLAVAEANRINANSSARLLAASASRCVPAPALHSPRGLLCDVTHAASQVHPTLKRRRCRRYLSYRCHMLRRYAVDMVRMSSMLHVRSLDFPAHATPPRAADFGRTLYSECIQTNRTIPAGGGWEYVFKLADGPTTEIELSSTSAEFYKLGNLFAGKKGGEPAHYDNQPEVACYAICQKQLGDKGCTFFTYDGLNKDTCASVLLSYLALCRPRCHFFR
jgi:hypothetical protein